MKSQLNPITQVAQTPSIENTDPLGGYVACTWLVPIVAFVLGCTQFWANSNSRVRVKPLV
jgi:hypothetical protein